MKERRGRTNNTSDGVRKGRPPKPKKGIEEDLIAENQRLRMEIEYLKKLSALVLAEERENGKKAIIVSELRQKVSAERPAATVRAGPEHILLLPQIPRNR